MLEAIQEKPTFQEKVDLNLVIISKEKASSSQSNILVVIELIEKYLFFSNGKRTSNPYRKSVRKLTFDLKGNKGGLRDSLAHLLLDTPCYKSVSKILRSYVLLRFSRAVLTFVSCSEPLYRYLLTSLLCLHY